MYAVDGFYFWIFVTFCILQWHFFWRSYFLEKIRSDLFIIRENLFYYAAEGHLNFDNPVYIRLRNRINILLRYAHRTNALSLLVISLVMLRDKKFQEDYSKESEVLNKLIDKLSHSQRDFIAKLIQSLNNRVTRFILFSSPFFTTGFLIIIIIQIILQLSHINALINPAELWKKISGRVSQQFEKDVYYEMASRHRLVI